MEGRPWLGSNPGERFIFCVSLIFDLTFLHFQPFIAPLTPSHAWLGLHHPAHSLLLSSRFQLSCLSPLLKPGNVILPSSFKPQRDSTMASTPKQRSLGEIVLVSKGDRLGHWLRRHRGAQEFGLRPGRVIFFSGVRRCSIELEIGELCEVGSILMWYAFVSSLPLWSVSK